MRYAVAAFMLLTVLAAAVYVDCRFEGGSTNDCRSVFRNAQNFLLSLVK